MLPKNLAIVEDDIDFGELLARHLRGLGVAVTLFKDGDDFLVAASTYDFDFYVLDLSLSSVDGLDLIRLLRRRVQVGIVVVSGRLGPEVFDAVLTAGADMHLAKPVRFEQVTLAVKTVHRRSASVTHPTQAAWRLDRRGRRLLTPEGISIDLGDNDLTVMETFIAADNNTVTHAQLRQSLGRNASAEADNWLHATIYRLRRRIEKATPEIVPLQSQARVGYVFRGKLIAD